MSSSDEKKTEFRVSVFLIISSAVVNAIISFALLCQQNSAQFHFGEDNSLIRDSLLIGIGASIPILINMIMKAANDERLTLSLLFRFTLFITLQIPDAIIFSMITGSFNNTSNLAGIYIASAVFKVASSISCVCGIITSHSDCRAMCSTSYIQSGFLVLSATIYVVLAAIGYGPYSLNSGSSRAGATVVLLVILCQVLVLLTSSFRRWKLSYKTEPEIGPSDLNGNNIIVFFSLVLLLIRVVSTVSLMASCGPIIEGYINMTSRSIALDQYFQIAFMVGLLVVPWPLIEAAAIRCMRSVLSEKSAFTRYIAHEVRAPLNVACLSLTFMKAEAYVLRSFADSDQVSSILDAMVDVDSSCKTAISILNDVLSFDKLKGDL